MSEDPNAVARELIQKGFSTDYETRKRQPVLTGVVDYFPLALLAISEVSIVGNEQHNPGQPLHWERTKSTDEGNTAMRHLMQRGTRDSDGARHTAKAAWRILACLEKEIEAEIAARENATSPVRVTDGERFVAPDPLTEGKYYEIVRIGSDGDPQHVIGEIRRCGDGPDEIGIVDRDKLGAAAYFFHGGMHGTYVAEVVEVAGPDA